MKKVFKIFALLLWVITLCFPLHVSAVRAYPYPVEVKQPNGETITIQSHGDEFFRYVTTTDGYVIALDSEGYFTFAEINSEGNIQPGKVRVSANVLKSSNNSFLRADSPEFIQKVKQPVLSRRSGALKNVAALRSSSASRMRSAKNIAAGDTPALVILAAFNDQAFSINNANQAFTNMLNTSGYQPSGATGFTGSVRDYFISSSDGAYSPKFMVYGPVTLPQNMAFYGANDKDGNDVNAGQMIIDAVTAAQKYFNLNLADFPRTDDGSLDNVCVIYAGYNEAENANMPNTIWPHQWYLSELSFSDADRTVGGVKLDSYMCTSELRGQQSATKNMAGIGTFCHEYGHTLGQPDLYDANGSTDGWVLTEPGFWCIMSAGNYNNNGNTPPAYGVIERWWLGWLDIWDISRAGGKIPPITSSNQYKAFAIDTPTDEYEFFTLEVRKKEGWDSSLPGEGMLIYHIDMTDYNVQTEYGNVTMAQLWGGGIPNIAAIRPGMQLMTANRDTMTVSGGSSSYTKGGYLGHPFPGANGITSISDTTTPGFLSWNGQKSGVSISNIVRNADGSVLFSYSKSGNDMKENNINSPVAFSNDNIIYFKNISGNTQVSVYDVKGILYSSKSISEPDNLKITVPGIYIVKLQTNNEVFTYKIVIK